MSTAAKPNSGGSGTARVTAVEVTEDMIIARARRWTDDRRTRSRGRGGCPTRRPISESRYEIIGEGTGIHWPDVDEDLSVRGMLEGVPAKRPGT